MVHRNTEYKIKYYFPNEELSKKIWLDNIRFRENRRAMNLADHYWDFQTSNEACDCEDCSKSRTKCDGIATQKGDDKSDVKVTPSNLSKIDQEPNSASAHSSREAAVQTPKWIPARNSETVNLGNLSLTKKGLQSPENGRRSLEAQKNGHVPLLKKQPTRTSPSMAAISQYSLSKMSKRLQDMHDVQSLFFPFGWNNDNKNIGDMKTFNVLAPQKEVHPPAIMAMKRRKAQFEQFLLSQDEKKKQKSASLLSIPRVNHSSIWISEYRDKYSKSGMTSR